MDKARLFVNSTLTKLRAFFPSVKTHSNPCPAWPERQNPFWSYILYYQDKAKPQFRPLKIPSQHTEISTPDHIKKSKTVYQGVGSLCEPTPSKSF
ncbi:hypothetical protein, partial [Klebsiella pneumoniae]